MSTPNIVSLSISFRRGAITLTQFREGVQQLLASDGETENIAIDVEGLHDRAEGEE